MAPQVSNLNDVIAQLQQGVAGQKSTIDTAIAANDASGAAQVAGLDAKKNTAFGDITQQAQNKGMFFSGFSPDAQAKYTADTYLPAVAQLQNTIASTRANLLGQKSALDDQVFNKAYDTVQSDKQTLASWNQMTAQQQFQASEADKQRAFDAQQNEANRNAQAAASAASNAKPSVNQAVLTALSSGYDGSTGKTAPGLAEALIPQIVADYGLSQQDASNLVYNTRKQYFKE